MSFRNKMAGAILLLLSVKGYAQQFDVNADMRMRYENRHGYSVLFTDSLKAANFVAQRTRLNFDYTSQHIKLRVAPQNVRVWGDVATGAKTDINAQLHETWAEILVSNTFSFKAGRQELDYDDSRILGNVDWTMQARSHDALVFKLAPDTISNIHIGVALNANKETNSKENYAVPQYKTMQYGWYHARLGNAGLSILALNQAIPYIETAKEKLAWNQTFGPRFTYTKNKLAFDAAAYMQTGKIAGNDMLAAYISANINYKFSNRWSYGLGCEFLSGKAGNDASATVKSFMPWFGTNHKFNGYMDYFYVSNITNPAGLTDIYANIAFEKDRMKIRLTPHCFNTAAALYKGSEKMSGYLGTEIDITASYQLFTNVVLNCGYSQMLATTSMELLKGGNHNINNNWVFVALHVNPKLFSFKASPPKTI